MFRKTILAITTIVILALAVSFGRLFVGIPFVPPSGREIVTRLSGLPIPVFVRSEDAEDECSGMLCSNYYGRGLIRLGPASCANAVAGAKRKGWQSLPVPDGLTILQQYGAPPTPRQGYFRFEQIRPTEDVFTWIDTTTCRVYAEINIT